MATKSLSLPFTAWMPKGDLSLTIKLSVILHCHLVVCDGWRSASASCKSGTKLGSMIMV